MNIKDAQKDMRDAYIGGGTGALVSGLVWIMAGVVALNAPQKTAVIAFLIGGVLIFPLSVVLDKLLGRRGKHDPENPLGVLALETTFMMLMGIAVALAVYSLKPIWFFPAMLMVIAGRYLCFSTLYGLKLYWVFAGALFLAGWFIFSSQGLPFYMGGLIGGGVELIFAGLLLYTNRSGAS